MVCIGSEPGAVVSHVKWLGLLDAVLGWTSSGSLAITPYKTNFNSQTRSINPKESCETKYLNSILRTCRGMARLVHDVVELFTHSTPRLAIETHAIASKPVDRTKALI